MADDDVIKGPDGRNVLVFPHGVVGHYRANGKNNGIPGFHFTVYCAETVSSMFSDFLSGGKYTPRERMTQIGNTAANCIFIHGFDSGLLSDDMGGGGLQDPVEERLGGPAFREVRFRGGGRAQSRWHLTDRTSDIGDSRTHIAVTGRGQATLGMAFTDFPDRLEMINTADKRLGQEFRVGFDITRLLMAGIMDGVVKL